MLTLQESFAKVQRNLCLSGISFGAANGQSPGTGFSLPFSEIFASQGSASVLQMANLQGQALACPRVASVVVMLRTGGSLQARGAQPSRITCAIPSTAVWVIESWTDFTPSRSAIFAASP